MDMIKAKDFVKDFFEKYYAKLRNEDEILVRLPDVPDEMLADGADPKEEWNVWKMIPSTVTDEDLAEYENNYNLKFPVMMKAFLTTYHHLFEEPIGRNSITEKLEALDHAYNPHLTANLFLPFTWDREHYFIRCIDLSNMPDEENCPVVQIDHENLFDIMYDAEEKGEILTREQLLEYMSPVSDNFFEYLNDVYNGLDEYDDEDEDD